MTERFCGISAVLNGNVARTNEAGFSRDSRMVDDPNDDHEDEHYRVRGRFKHPVRAILDDIDHQENLMPGGHASIAGAWVLDLSRSDTMSGYLECMQVPPAGIEAQVTGERTHDSLNVVGIHGSTLTVHKQTSINNFTETFELDQEKVTPTRYGARRSTASLRDWGPDGLVCSTTTPTPGGVVHLVETRQLLDGGLSHAQELHVHNLTTGVQSITLRTWTRVPMTPEHRAALAESGFARQARAVVRWAGVREKERGGWRYVIRCLLHGDDVTRATNGGGGGRCAGGVGGVDGVCGGDAGGEFLWSRGKRVHGGTVGPGGHDRADKPWRASDRGRATACSNAVACRSERVEM
eukprot:jgi/Undpi1/5904/HiC_scaffold_2.g01178.m1